MLSGFYSRFIVGENLNQFLVFLFSQSVFQVDDLVEFELGDCPSLGDCMRTPEYDIAAFFNMSKHVCRCCHMFPANPKTQGLDGVVVGSLNLSVVSKKLHRYPFPIKSRPGSQPWRFESALREFLGGGTKKTIYQQ